MSAWALGAWALGAWKGTAWAEDIVVPPDPQPNPNPGAVGAISFARPIDEESAAERKRRHALWILLMSQP